MSEFFGERNNLSTTKDRRQWIRELAQAEGPALASLWSATERSPDFTFLRPPEIGAVMTQGRIGASGASFNFGEATATRCAVRLSSGEEGHSYALGRDKRKAVIAALCDALMQTDAADAIASQVIRPLAEARAQREERDARKAAATKVEFFTMTRGEDT